MTKVRPLGDKILIKRADADDKTDAGIYLPESAKDNRWSLRRCKSSLICQGLTMSWHH